MIIKKRILAFCLALAMVVLLAGPGELTPRAASGSVSVYYRTHVQSIGWQGWRKDGCMAGTEGRALRLEGLQVKLENTTKYSGGVNYRVHVQSIGWQRWYKDGKRAGTSGRSLRLEAVQIYLTGELAQHYDLYYRVHAQHFGWLNWAKNGEPAGTAGYAYRLEGIQITLVKKGAAPVKGFRGIKSAKKLAFIKTAASKTPDNPYYTEHPEERMGSKQKKVVITKEEPIKLTTKEFKLLCAVVYCEAGGEIDDGQLAMANIVLNRLRAGIYGKTLTEVVYAPYQFEVVTFDSFKKALKEGVPEKTQKACKLAVNGRNNIGDYVNVRPTWYMDPETLPEYIIIDHIIFFK